MLDPKLLEQIDACRPGSRDVEQPELAALAKALSGEGETLNGGPLNGDGETRAAYAAIQQFDRRVGATMHELPVPLGLADRILAQLGRSAQDASHTSADPAPASGRAAAFAAQATCPTAQSTDITVAPLADRFARGSRGRRRLITAGALLAASVLLAVGVGRFGWQNETSQVAVTEKAAVWYEHLGDGWQPLAKLPQGFDIPSSVSGSVRGWQLVSSNVARSGVVYDLGAGQAGGAVLFVIKATRPELPTAAPRVPQSTTAGLAIGAWRSGGLVYVLVVRGDERAYKKLMQSAQPLA